MKLLAFGEDRKLYTQLGGWKWQKLIALQRTNAEEQRKPRFLEEVPPLDGDFN